MGVKQDGEPIGDVVLPPWAKVCYLPLPLPMILYYSTILIGIVFSVDNKFYLFPEL